MPKSVPLVQGHHDGQTLRGARNLLENHNAHRTIVEEAGPDLEEPGGPCVDGGRPLFLGSKIARRGGGETIKGKRVRHVETNAGARRRNGQEKGCEGDSALSEALPKSLRAQMLDL